MRRAIVVSVVAVVGLWLVVALAATPSETKLGRCLPVSDEVAGWKVKANTYKYCGTPDGLADLYDGGYEVYVEAGIIKAASLGYNNGDRTIVVYIHEFKTAGQCKTYWQKEVKKYEDKYGKTTVTATEGAAYSKVGAQVIGNVYRGVVHARVLALGTSTEQQQANASFMKKISEKIGKNYQ